MVARLLVIVSLAALVALSVACGGSDKSSAKNTAGPLTKSTLPVANTPTSFEAMPASEDRTVWDAIAARVSANLSPVLRPPSSPEGFDTVKAFMGDSYFAVEYSGTNKRLSITGGYLSNPELPTGAGHQETVMMRGIDCTVGSKEKPCPFLQVRSDANPKESSFLMWQEPGHEVFPGAETRDSVEYLLSTQGLDPQFLIDFAKTLSAQ